MNPAWALGATVLWGGVVSTDAAAFPQILISQPLVAGAVTGFVWGRPDIGLELGAILQLFASPVLPLGGRTPEDYPAGTVAGVGVAAGLAAPAGAPWALEASLLWGLAAAFLIAVGGMRVTTWMRRANEGLARWCEAELVAGNLGALGRAQWAGVAQAFAVGTAFTGVALVVFGLAGHALLTHQGYVLARAWRSGSPWFWGFGAGIAARGFAVGRRPGLFFWAALVAFLMVRLVVER